MTDQFEPYVAYMHCGGKHTQQRTTLVCKAGATRGRYWVVWITDGGVAASTVTESMLAGASRPVSPVLVKKAVSRLRKCGRTLGISKTARTLLTEVKP